MDEGLRQRMLAMFPPTKGGEPGADADGAAAGTGTNSSTAAGPGASQLPTLHAVIVELDGKFITELTHTAALFAELFPPGGRKRLIKVCATRLDTAGGACSRGEGRCRESQWKGGSSGEAVELGWGSAVRWRAAIASGMCSTSTAPWTCGQVGSWGLPLLAVTASPAANAPAHGLGSCGPAPLPPSPPVCGQMSRECFTRYLKLTRRALSDASAIAAASAAGISSSGEMVQPLEERLRAAEAAAEEGYEAGVEDSIAAGGWAIGRGVFVSAYMGGQVSRQEGVGRCVDG